MNCIFAAGHSYAICHFPVNLFALLFAHKLTCRIQHVLNLAFLLLFPGPKDLCDVVVNPDTHSTDYSALLTLFECTFIMLWPVINQAEHGMCILLLMWGMVPLPV